MNVVEFPIYRQLRTESLAGRRFCVHDRRSRIRARLGYRSRRADGKFPKRRLKKVGADQLGCPSPNLKLQTSLGTPAYVLAPPIRQGPHPTPGDKWRARRDLNPRPSASKAYTEELLPPANPRYHPLFMRRPSRLCFAASVMDCYHF